MTYLEFYDAAINGSNLTKRVQVAAVAWALTVNALSDTDPTKVKKQEWATEIFTKPLSSAIKLMWFAIGTIGISGDGSTIPDTSLQTSVNNISNTHYANALLMPDMSSIIRAQQLLG